MSISQRTEITNEIKQEIRGCLTAPVKPVGSSMVVWVLLLKCLYDGFNLMRFQGAQEEGFCYKVLKEYMVLVAVVLFTLYRNYTQLSGSNENYLKAVTSHNKAVMSTETPLPRVFSVRLDTLINTSPSDLANALSDVSIRPLWEPRLA